MKTEKKGKKKKEKVDEGRGQQVDGGPLMAAGEKRTCLFCVRRWMCMDNQCSRDEAKKRKALLSFVSPSFLTSSSSYSDLHFGTSS